VSVDSAELTVRLSALTERFSSLADDLAEAGRALQDRATLPPEQLPDDISAVLTAFEELRAHLASAVGGAESLLSLSDVDAAVRALVEEEARRARQTAARRTAEEQVRRRDEAARREAAEQALREAEAAVQREAEEQARREAEEAARREADAAARRGAEQAARREADAAAQREAEEQARREAEAGARREAEEAARREADAAAQREAEEQARREAEAAARREAEEAARREAEAAARRQAEEQARREAEAASRREAEEKAQREAEEKARREAEETSRREAAAQRKAQEEALRKAQDDARRRAEDAQRRLQEARRRVVDEGRAKAEVEAGRQAEVRDKAAAQWWFSAATAWDRLRARGVSFTDAVREELAKFPYLFSVPIQESVQYEDGLLAASYGVLLLHVEHRVAGFVARADAQVAASAGETLGARLYRRLATDGGVAATYPEFVRELMVAAIPNPGVWVDAGLSETEAATARFERSSPRIGNPELRPQRVPADQRFGEHHFSLTIAPLTARFVRVNASDLREPRAVELTLRDGGTPTDQAWILPVRAGAMAGAQGAILRHTRGGSPITGLGGEWSAVWIGVFNVSPEASKSFELTVTLKRGAAEKPSAFSRPTRKSR
jgi:hypothetical protein